MIVFTYAALGAPVVLFRSFEYSVSANPALYKRTLFDLYGISEGDLSPPQHLAAAQALIRPAALRLVLQHQHGEVVGELPGPEFAQQPLRSVGELRVSR